jgi:oleate hydratase
MIISQEGADLLLFKRPAPRVGAKAWLVGGGIASMAAAVFLIRDGDMLGSDITILEQSDLIGGSLDGSGSPETGYVLRGGRMLESKYLCTLDLFSSIPTVARDSSVTEEILDWNRTMQTSSKSRLFVDGHRQTAPAFGLTERHILNIERLAIEPEAMLGRTTIAEQFDPAFFETNFWFMWCTTFAFQPWHSAVEFKRYLVRFAHMVGGFNRLTGIMRTVYNQYDSLVLPLRKWLEDRGVHFETGVQVIDLEFEHRGGGEAVKRVIIEKACVRERIAIGDDDYVLVTLGSMTEGSSLGGMEAVPELNGGADGPAWQLWQTIAAGREDFGHPAVFAGDVDGSKWVSFTTTLTDPAFLNLVREATGNVPGEGGLVTFPESSWLASIVIPHQPHFIDQPENVTVFWGYGLHVDAIGDFVKKPMAACTGREIMTEIIGHLGIAEQTETILAAANCIPCMMPFITSQFMPRTHGDRPMVVPVLSVNYGFIGQFCELPDDVVFTVEYSIRSAQAAVAELLGLDRTPPPVYKGAFDPRVLFAAFVALHDLGDTTPERVLDAV